MCGEHPIVSRTLLGMAGSSPHVRGAQRRTDQTHPRRGIIPACAGSTPSKRIPTTARRDHPRMCGEHESRAAMSLVESGSSPHVRGAPVAPVMVSGVVGIIPACAGSTRPPRRPSWAERDHPRMCGEHALVKLKDTGDRGSSPHVRGARRG